MVNFPTYTNRRRMGDANTMKEAIAATKKVLHIENAQVVTECIIPIPHAYVIYDTWRDQNLPKLLTALTKQQVYSIGRYGEWKYSSMQEAVLDGKKIAERLTVLPAYKTSDTRIKPSTRVNKEKMHVPQSVKNYYAVVILLVPITHATDPGDAWLLRLPAFLSRSTRFW